MVVPASVAYRRVRAESVRRGILTQVTARAPGTVAAHALPVHLWPLRGPRTPDDAATTVRVSDLTVNDPDGPLESRPEQVRRPSELLPALDIAAQHRHGAASPGQERTGRPAPLAHRPPSRPRTLPTRLPKSLTPENAYAWALGTWHHGALHVVRMADVRAECLTEGEAVADWIYILNPHKDTLDGEPSDKETMRRLAEEEPELELWLSRRNRMIQGDRIWFFFTHPESAVAAVAEVDDEPRRDPEDPDIPYLVAVTLLAEATKALYRDPVSREELGLGQVRSVQKVKPEALPALLARTGL